SRGPLPRAPAPMTRSHPRRRAANVASALLPVEQDAQRRDRDRGQGDDQVAALLGGELAVLAHEGLPRAVTRLLRVHSALSSDRHRASTFVPTEPITAIAETTSSPATRAYSRTSPPRSSRAKCDKRLVRVFMRLTSARTGEGFRCVVCNFGFRAPRNV